MPEPQLEDRLDTRGLVLAFAAYLLWGAFPLYFHYLAPAGPVEIIGHRIFWSFVFCFAGVLLWREWGHLRDVVDYDAGMRLLVARP